MSTASSESPVFTLTLTAEEREQLLSYLDQALRDTRVEAHRTDAPDYRAWVERREAVLQNLVDRLRRP
jgi:hypothetical protein